MAEGSRGKTSFGRGVWRRKNKHQERALLRELYGQWCRFFALQQLYHFRIERARAKTKGFRVAEL